MCVCVCVCARVCVSWWSLHLSPCPPNATAPARESLAYLSAGRPPSLTGPAACLTSLESVHTPQSIRFLFVLASSPPSSSPLMLYSLLCSLIFALNLLSISVFSQIPSNLSSHLSNLWYLPPLSCQTHLHLRDPSPLCFVLSHLPSFLPEHAKLPPKT